MSDRFEDKGNGVVLDQLTGLMWSPIIGFASDAGASLNGAVMSWPTATARFGRGRSIKGGILFSSREAAETSLKSSSYEGYRFGSETVSMAGFDDWRLPVAEEWWTLAEKTMLGGRAEVNLATVLLGEKKTSCWTASNYGWLNGMEAAWQVICSPSGYPDVVGDIGPGAKFQVRLVRGGNVFSGVEFPASAFRGREAIRVRFQTQPFLLAHPVAWLLSTYGLSDKEVFERRSFLGIEFGARPRMRIENVTRIHATGLLWGDVIFGEGSAEPVVWRGVFRPEAIRKRAQFELDRALAKREGSPLIP